MKKLQFIYPKFLCFKFNVVFLFVIILQLEAVATDGVDGCHIIAGLQDRNYHTPYTLGNGSPTEWISTSSGGGGYNLITSSKCLNDVGPACNVYRFGTTGASPPATQILYSGNYAVFFACPIDDYIPVLFIFTFSVAFIRLKSRLI